MSNFDPGANWNHKPYHPPVISTSERITDVVGIVTLVVGVPAFIVALFVAPVVTLLAVIALAVVVIACRN